MNTSDQGTRSREGAKGPGEGQRRKSLKPLRRILPYLMRYRGRLAAAVFFLSLAAVTTLSLPVAVRRVIDEGFNGRDTFIIDAYFGTLFAIAGVLAIASAGRYYFVVSLGERMVSDLRKDVFDHLTRLSASFYDRSHSGELVSRLTADTTQIKSAFGSTASIALRNFILFVGAVIMMIATSASLSLVVIAAIPAIVLPLVAFGRRVRSRARAAQDTLADASAYASESIGAIRTVHAFSNEKRTSAHFSGQIERAFEAARSSIGARALLTAFAIFLIFSSIVAVLWIGAARVAEGSLSAGTLGQFLLYAVFAAGALGQLSEVGGELASAAGAAERLTELVDETPEIAAPASPAQLPAKIAGAIRFENVSFAYESRAQLPALKDMSFEIQPGETVAFVGASGAGKSTIFSLIERFYDPQAGRILLDGMDLRECDPAELRRHIALVPQDVAIFAASVADNVGFGNPDASEDDVRRVAATAQAAHFVDDLPRGYDTVLGERGITLSGGQRQRIAIARAMLRNAPVLLLDEATSALDAENELLVQDALDALMKGRTTLVIAHRLATVLKADRILVVDGGRIVEEGTHATLSAREGLYARLARLQFGTERFEQAAE